jgi:hypothetical protein
MQVRELMWTMQERVRKFVREKVSAFFQTRRRIVLLSLGGLAVVVILGFAAVFMIQNHVRTVRSQAAARELADSFKPQAIPPEDFFLPGEPDLLPDILPERFPRDTWTIDDARPYWTDPLEGNARLWRDRFGSAIDDLLEGVP